MVCLEMHQDPTCSILFGKFRENLGDAASPLLYDKSYVNDLFVIKRKGKRCITSHMNL